MIKYGVVTKDSHSDFDLTKKAEYYDAASENIADEANKSKLISPIKITEEIVEEN